MRAALHLAIFGQKTLATLPARLDTSPRTRTTSRKPPCSKIRPPIRHPRLRPAGRLPHRRICRHRTRSLCLHDAGGYGRGGGHARSGRRQEESEIGGRARTQGGRTRPQGQGRHRAGARSPGQCRCAGRGLSPRRDGAARARAGRGACAQSAPGLWPHDRMGSGRPAGPGRRP